MHATQIARVHRVATAPFTRRRLEHHDTGARFSGHQGGAQSSVAATNDQYIKAHPNTPFSELVATQATVNRNHGARDVAGQRR